MIRVGDTLPDAELFEYLDDARVGCTLGPNAFSVREQTAGRRVAIFGLPGAFTPTCSTQHVPGYVEHAERLRAAGIDEI
ncbi:Peroxiredoxin [Burkholderia singularis]|uniref:Peroxiredoxin n=1 Tax=Burkholderia singularis TaxID=1503053 RepID=A0A238H849_9BURK|nr:Peroxiredoxin [Burkholderia singularis]